MNHRANAKFFLYLADRGLSFAPHTPKAHSDRVGLWRAICYELGSVGWFECELLKEIVRISLREKSVMFTTEKRGQRTILSTRLKSNEVSPLGRLRLLMYFAPIIPAKDAVFLGRFL